MPSSISRLSSCRGRSIFPAFLLAVILCLWNSTSQGAGYRVIEEQGMKISLWYPTDVPDQLQRLGPFETEMAKDVPVRDGKHEVVLLSHGSTGRARNHYLTAEVLAKAGFFVIAPQHTADYLVGGRKTAQVLDYRYMELVRALDIVRNIPDYGEYLAREPVHGVGYSLGGATIMLASGAKFSTDITEEYCDVHARQDAEFCDDPGFIYRLIQSFKNTRPDLRKTSELFQDNAIITGNAVIIAPVFQGIDLSGPLSMAELTVIGINGDEIAKPEFHANPLFEAASNTVESRYETVDGHHFAFIAPFPKWLTDKEYIPVAIDPEGFNRKEFLDNVNVMILDAINGE